VELTYVVGLTWLLLHIIKNMQSRLVVYAQEECIGEMDSP